MLDLAARPGFMRDIAEENGAVEVDEATELPLIVFLGGPIKHWWSKREDGTPVWDSPEHREYMAWRDRVRLTIVATGVCVTYSPHRAIQGSWHPTLQSVNDSAIWASDVLLALTPPGVPADGTAEEIALAGEYGVPVWRVPPGNDGDLEHLVERLLDFRAEKPLRFIH